MDATLAPAIAPVGFLGLGLMGGRMALRLAHAGSPLVVWDRTPAKTEALVAAGARTGRRPVDVGRSVGRGIVLTMLRDGPAVRSTVLGRSGVAKGLLPGSLLVDLSTVAPGESRALSQELAPLGIHFLDAPVGGSLDAAESGSLTFFVGGDPAHVDRARPLLAHMGHELHHLGPVGQGSAMKLVNNLLTIGHVAMAAEALVLGERLGIDRARAIELLLRGGGRSAMLERKRTQLLERRYDPQFRLDLARKDLRLIEQAARGAGAGTRISREVRRLLDEALREGHASEDFSVLLEAALRRGGPGGGVVAGAAARAEAP